jgi:class 3 adenylate cyclase
VSAPAASAPSGVVTFLFTDVEGWTRRWEADAQAMGTALAAHDKVSVDAAVAVQRALELPARMGFATGETELRVRITSVRVLDSAARLMAAGHSGQVLLAVNPHFLQALGIPLAPRLLGVPVRRWGESDDG